MAKYKISPGGKWRGTYSTLEEAGSAAEVEAAHLNEIVFVVKVEALGNQLVTAFPPDRRERARSLEQPDVPDEVGLGCLISILRAELDSPAASHSSIRRIADCYELLDVLSSS